ncbi:DEAD/DEAH box helicase family protein, partial [Candidatus Pacearchaeota archaeon]|nr:DEAD/DEAH box helicase family protein [Candidatus Pacearchaeota archaeon]
MREISGPFSQQSLKKKLDNALRKKDISQIEINPNIVDRSRGIQIVKQILDHFNSGKRNALINMATGTGKTRVSMAIIDSLVNKAKSVTNVLFVVDRIALGNNAFYKGFQKFFRDTPQGLLNLEGFFDLIIYDEAHRSYYDKQNLVMNYFDSLKIGLTATPSKNEDRNTYDLFECERGKPTVEYTYDEAIKDGVLVPYDAQIIETKVTKFGIKGADLSPELKTMLIKQDADPDSFEMPGARLFKNFIDKKTNELIVTEFMNRCYRDEAGRPCKTIFFCVNVKHAQALKKVFDELYPKFSSEDVDVIVSSYDRYMDAVDRFLKDSSPRIALSVGVLDTGIDIPEAMNLVFVTPVFSHIRFWQMLGRGTRNKSAVIGNSPDHVKWLPVYDGVHDKKDFRILDFKFGEFSNVKEHQLEKTDNKLSSEDIREKIFDKQLEVLKKKLDDKEKKIVEEHIIDRIKKIDQKSFIVRDKVPMIKKVVSREYDLTSHIKEIKSEIKPLLKFSEFGDGRIQTFISHCSDLFRYVKESDIDAISKEQKFVSERIINVWETNLEAVRKKEDGIKKILQDKFWNELTFEDIDFLIREIAPLMVYYEKQ